jgi:ATP-dependent Lhr-like helicase
LQAEQELLAQELEIGRLRASLVRMNAQALVVQALARPTPFAFPLMVERFREKLSNESLAERIARMVEQLEKARAARCRHGGRGAAASVRHRCTRPAAATVRRFARAAVPRRRPSAP